MTCPNCGAELELHTFGHVCQYCGYISSNITEEYSNENEQKRFAHECYKYITRNISYITSHSEFVSAKQNASSYEIQCAKAFHPLDKQYQIIHGVELFWKAIIDRKSIRLFLLAKGNKSINGSIVISLDEMINLIFYETGLNTSLDEYIVPYKDFEAICNSSAISFAIDENKYDEFRIYSHRFYNLVFNRAKYVYAINQHLLTD